MEDHPSDKAYTSGQRFAKGWANAAPEEFDDIEAKALKVAETTEDPEAFMDGFYDRMDAQS
jgi:hypothetical protein